jgi:uncharacterized protein (TIGR03067 family)
MDPAVRELVNRLDDRLGHLSSQMEELHESVRQVVVVAEADPEMALTKARKVLESVLRRVWEHFIPNEPIGTRPLEEILQRLQKNGYLPRKQAAYAVAVKELGNVGTHVHDEKVDKADVVQALSPLISVLEWYFEQDWAVCAAPAKTAATTAAPAPSRARDHVAPEPGPARRPRYLIPLGVAVAVSVLSVIVVGSQLMFRKTPLQQVPSIAQTAPPPQTTPPLSDQKRIQGRWQVVDQESSKAKSKTPFPSTAVWEFQGESLTIHRTSNADEDQRGTFSLSRGAEQKLFDFSSTRPDGSPFDMLGIYEFDGDFLKLCYWIRLDPADAQFKRPDSFAVAPGTRRIYVKLRRVGA